MHVIGYDPFLEPQEVQAEFGIQAFSEWRDIPGVDGIIICAAHRQFAEMGKEQYEYVLHNPGVVMDVNGALADKRYFEGGGVEYLRL